MVCLLAILMIMGCLSSCAERVGEGKLSVVCTTFVQYDWARKILGESDGVSLTLLVSGGKDMHSFEPSAADMVRVLESDLLIYTGGVSEAWVDELAARGELKRPLSLLDCLGNDVKYVEYTEGMEHTHGGEGHSEHGAEHTHGEVDEHVWLSLKNAARLCERIADELCELDAENVEVYRANCARYISELLALDGEYALAVAGAAHKTLVVADRHPYRYLFDDYGISCHAAFAGCSTESEASFATVVFLAGKVDELDLSGVIVTESSDGRLAKTVVESTAAKNAEIYTLHSLQTVSSTESYLGVMRENLETIKKILN